MDQKVIIGKDEYSGTETTARCIASVACGDTRFETWSVDRRGDHTEFQCYQDRREDWTEAGQPSGKLEPGVYVFFVAAGSGEVR